MKTLILIATLFLTIPLAGQDYHNVKIFKYLKKYDRDSLVQTSVLNTSVNIDTSKKTVRICSKSDDLLIKGIWLKKIGPNKYEFSKKIDWHPLTYATCQLVIQEGKTIVYTHYKYHLKQYKYKLVFF